MFGTKARTLAQTPKVPHPLRFSKGGAFDLIPRDRMSSRHSPAANPGDFLLENIPRYMTSYRMSMIRRVVLDTSVVVAALRTRSGAGNAVLRLVATRRLTPLATPPLFLEYEDVLKRAEQRLAHGLALEAIDEFLAELAALIEPVEVHFRWRPQLRDPNDEMVLEAAIHGRADALITYNLADFKAAGDRFKIPVLRPADLLKAVKR
jgi:putative PIN family toxin of toxin-antitoxin system